MNKTSPEAVTSARPHISGTEAILRFYGSIGDYHQLVDAHLRGPEPRLTEAGRDQLPPLPAPPGRPVPIPAGSQQVKPVPGAGARFLRGMNELDRARWAQDKPQLLLAPAAVLQRAPAVLPQVAGPALRIERMAAVFEAAGEAQRALYREHRELIQVLATVIEKLDKISSHS